MLQTPPGLTCLLARLELGSLTFLEGWLHIRVLIIFKATKHLGEVVASPRNAVVASLRMHHQQLRAIQYYGSFPPLLNLHKRVFVIDVNFPTLTLPGTIARFFRGGIRVFVAGLAIPHRGREDAG